MELAIYFKQTKDFMALFYDGLRPEPIQAHLSLAPSKEFILSFATKEYRIAYCNVARADWRDELLLIEIHPDKNQGAFHWELRLSGKEAHDFLLKFHEQRPMARVKSFFNSRHLLILTSIVIICAIGVWKSFHYAVPHIAQLAPDGIDKGLGEGIAKQIEKRWSVCTDPRAQEVLQEMLDTLTEGEDLRYPPRIRWIREKQINAFALPGGEIFLLDGLVQKSESPEEVLGVLAHELGHSEKRHGLQQLIRSIGTFAMIDLFFGFGVEGVELVEDWETLENITSVFSLMSYGREMEADADRYGAELMKRHLIDLGGVEDFFDQLAKGTLMQDSAILQDSAIVDSENSQIEKISTVDGRDSLQSVARDTTANSIELSLPEWLSTHPAPASRREFFKEMGASYQAKKYHWSFDWKEVKTLCPYQAPTDSSATEFKISF